MKLGRKHVAPISATAIIVGMLALVSVSPLLYRAFCAHTGYEGTPRINANATLLKGTRTLHVRFDGNVGGGLPWSFEPETAQMDLMTGKTATVFYKVTNNSDKAITARAVYNVGPPSIGAYFDKISCFCFSDQTLKAHETLEMPVVFFLDPALEKDETMNGVDEVVLSYTFYEQKAATVAAKDEPSKPRL
jgi:cytochrome c oxidase assembly protein subunit 11